MKRRPQRSVAARVAALVVVCGGVGAAGCTHADSATLSVLITDESDRPLGARLLLHDERDEALRIGVLDMYEGTRQDRGYCEMGADAIGTWDAILLPYGQATFSSGIDYCGLGTATIPPGRYRATVWRGIEYEIAESTIDLTEEGGEVTLHLVLERAFEPAGTMSADLHVHADNSNDSNVPNQVRVMGQVASGIQVIGLSDHNTNGSLEDDIAELGLSDVVTSIPSNEVTTDLAHFGAYPVTIRADQDRGGAPDFSEIQNYSAAELLELARSLGENPVVQVNHPRFRYAALFDHAGWDGVAWPPPFPLDFDAVEVLSGHTAFNTTGDRRLDQSLEDFYTFIDHGVLVTALGNSDTHHLNGVVDATTRSYVYMADPSVGSFDPDAFADAIRRRRAVATTGPWLEVRVAPSEGSAMRAGPGEQVSAEGGNVWATVELRQAAFVHADRIRILVGGEIAEEIDVPAGARSAAWAGELLVGEGDTWIGVDASGDDPLPVEMTGSYHIEKGREGVTPMALINPILVDGDGDGSVRLGQ